MTRYLVSTENDCKRMAAAAIRKNRIAKGHDPDTSPDGKPYTTQRSGAIVFGETGAVVGANPVASTPGTLTGNVLWIPHRDTDVEPADEPKEVAERDLGAEFDHRPMQVQLAATIKNLKR